MDRRAFLASSLAPALAGLAAGRSADFRAQFPMLEHTVWLNMASMGPLARFASAGMDVGVAFQQEGPGDGRSDYLRAVQEGVRGRFAELVGAREPEIGLVYCTKAGEQIAIDGVMDRLRAGDNVVTNDLHFMGSLNNLLGLRHSGVDVRIVRALDWRVSAERMVQAMDARTALVCVSLVSNINGHIEDVRVLADAVHERGGLLYADIIQAAGAMPLNLRELGVDVAACNGYKHLLGVYGAGFLFVRQEVQGEALPDRMYPGRARHGYAPWGPELEEAYSWSASSTARRYEAGHPNYIGYCAAYESLERLLAIGPERVRDHAVALNRRLIRALPRARFECISPDPDAIGIVTFRLSEPDQVRERLASSGVVVTLSGDRMRVSPGYFSTEADIDRLTEALIG
ncbi:MAG: aminotransferase class V-fold PLP-dependent enzyme [Rhodothermales bacterium]|nr:aminotransferase class V-fold PLP-dependent enzyme [Rhodothermales bacterium]MBO6778380.1 aminotransferase class V-fold PLP-dependent enzyme [Rhodothermales bacterium]